jgi:hypothetical protein
MSVESAPNEAASDSSLGVSDMGEKPLRGNESKDPLWKARKIRTRARHGLISIPLPSASDARGAEVPLPHPRAHEQLL